MANLSDPVRHLNCRMRVPPDPELRKAIVLHNVQVTEVTGEVHVVVVTAEVVGDMVVTVGAVGMMEVRDAARITDRL